LAELSQHWAASWIFPFRPWLVTSAVLLGITWLTFSRLLGEGIVDHVYQFGRETLRAVQAWENHGFFTMAGFFPLGGTYFDANTFPDRIYQSYPPLYLLPYWLGYHLFGESAFPNFKIGLAFAVIIVTGLLLATLATSTFASAVEGNRQLIFVVTYAITITNEALLRYCMIDEPDYLGLIVWLLGVVLLQRWWSKPESQARRMPLAIPLTFFLAAWIYPILAALSFLVAFGLQRVRLSGRLRRGVRAILLPAAAAIALYWIQRLIANIMFRDGRLLGSNLWDRMGLTHSQEYHDGVFNALEFLYWQKSGATPESSRVAIPQIIEHYAIWIIGVVLFVICLARLLETHKQLTLILAAAQMWLFVPLLHQSLAQHAWIYAIHFMPTVVLGWVGGLSLLLPRRSGDLFGPVALAGLGSLIWVIQIRFFLVNYWHT
jgi:hypothetical protein